MSAPIKSLLTPAQLSVGGKIDIKTAKGDITFTGTNIVAEGDVAVSAAGKLTVQSSSEGGNCPVPPSQ